MSMISLSPWWWILLPVLGLPIWWHRQRRLTQKMRTLATAQFLPASPPQLLKVWRWRDRLLLLLRSLILLTMLAILAVLVVPWRADTVFVAKGVTPQALESAVRASGFSNATRLTFCPEKICDITTEHLLFWLERHQVQWQAGARWLVVAPATALTMSASKPDLSHDLLMRVTASDTTMPQQRTLVVVINTTSGARVAEWRRLFSAFETASAGTLKLTLSEDYDARAALVIWDKPAPRDPAWRAPMIWQTISNAMPTKANVSSASSLMATLQSLHIDVQLQDATQIWTMDPAHDWPLKRLDDAKTLYEAWRSVYPSIVPLQEQTIKANPAAYLSLTASDTGLQNLLLGLLLFLFALERSLAHVRRA